MGANESGIANNQNGFIIKHYFNYLQYFPYKKEI